MIKAIKGISPILSTCIICFLFGCVITARSQQLPTQITSVEEKVFTERTESLIKGYFDNLSTISKLDDDKDVFIGELVKSSFENDKVRVYNDIDLTGSTQTDFDIPTYLSNISLFFSNSEIDFEIQKISFSKIFYSSDYFFIKAEIVRKMTMKLENQLKIDSTAIDIYVKFVPFKSNSRIYSVKKHENNITQFKTVTINPSNINETIGDEDKMFIIPKIKPGQFYLATVPDSATLTFVDYPDFGKKITPSTLTYPATKYNISLSKNEYETLDTVINIGSEKTKTFKLIPKFAFINFNVTPNNSEVLVNGNKVYFINSNKYDVKIQKGNTTIEISADHYYSKKVVANIEAGKIFDVKESLTPKNGNITLTADNTDAINALVTVDNIKVGNIPLSNYTLIEGKHTLKIEKSKFSTMVKVIDIKENIESKIGISMFTAVKTLIKTEPSSATIYIDNKEIGNSPLTTKLSVGSHTIRVEKKYYETKYDDIIVRENDEHTKLSYSLSQTKYRLHVNSHPQQSDVYIDGKPIGTTPVNIETEKGFHTIKILNENYFPRSFIGFVNTSNTSSYKRTLFPKLILNINILYGFESWGYEIGGTISHFSCSIDFFSSMKNKFTEVALLDNNSYTYDEYYMMKTNKKTSTSDSTSGVYAIKAGYVLLQPFIMRLHLGIGVIKINYFDVYQATKDYGLINKDDLLRGYELKNDAIISYIAGIQIPIRKINIGAEYWYVPQMKSDFVFRVGYNLF